MSRDADRYEAIIEILEDLEELSEDSVILVEGRKDVSALENLGISGDIFTVQSSGGPIKAAEYVFEQGKNAVILTDWDSKGDIIALDLENQLSALDVSFDRDIRERLAGQCRIDIKDVQALDELVEKLSYAVQS